MIHSYRARSSKRNLIYERLRELTISNELPSELNYIGPENLRFNEGRDLLIKQKQLSFYHQLGFYGGMNNIRVYDIMCFEGKAPLEISAREAEDYLLRSVLLLESMVGKSLEEVKVKTIFIPIKNKRENDIKIR
ncbi:hypothetical protein J4456_00910 [Candidatus Pacearchaeota archaeon]|nr:hypothetical protein [Candidatus Pacearchaeota archaeon]